MEAGRFTLLHIDLGAYQFALAYDLVSKIPQEGSIGLSKLAKDIGVDEDRLRRILRLLCSRRIFTEPEEDHFTQTHFTSTIARDQNIKDAVTYQTDEHFQTATDVALSFQTGAHSAFEQRHGMSIFEYYKQHPEKGERFASAMKGITKSESSVLPHGRL
jgi:predicted transcriptional regulator